MTVAQARFDQIQPALRALEARQTELVRQASTGRKADGHGDLGASAGAAIALRAELARQSALADNQSTLAARAEAMQTALGRISTLVSQAADDALTLSGTAPGYPRSIATAAREALREIGGLLNTRASGVFVFGGADATRRPVPDPEAIVGGGLVSGIGAEVAGLGVQPLATIAANTIAIAADRSAAVSPFSAWLEADAPTDPVLDPPGGFGAQLRTVAVDDGAGISLDLPANQNARAAAPSTPAGTGAFMRDIMRGLAVLAHADAVDANHADTKAFMGDISESLRSALGTLEQERAAIGVAEQRIASAQERGALLTDQVSIRLGAIEDTDMAAVLTRLEQVRTQLEASYRLTASLSQLSLARFLG